MYLVNETKCCCISYCQVTPTQANKATMKTNFMKHMKANFPRNEPQINS